MYFGKLPLKPLFRFVLFCTLLSPFAYLVYGALSGSFNPDPIDKLIEWTGLSAMYLLFVTVGLPVLQYYLAKLSLRWQLISYRRMLGLYVFFYASLHLLLVFIYIFGFKLETLLVELADKPFIWLGMLAWLLLLPLALTSSRAWQRRLKRNWKRLHLLVWPALLAVAIHYGLQLRGEAYVLLWLVPLTSYLILRKVKFKAV